VGFGSFPRQASNAPEKEGILGSMNVSETKAEGLVREYSIVITAAEIETQVSTKLAELAKTGEYAGLPSRQGADVRSQVPLSVRRLRATPSRRRLMRGPNRRSRAMTCVWQASQVSISKAMRTARTLRRH
jgi:hypothetical protein